MPGDLGAFLGLVAIVCAYPVNGTTALGLGARVAELTFAANAFAIAFTACALHLHAGHRARREAAIALRAASR